MPGIPANITIAGRTPATIKGNLPPLINTLASARGGFRATGPAAPEFTVSKTDTSITALITNGYGAESYESRVGSGAWSAGLTVSGLTAETAYAMQVRGIDDVGAGAVASEIVTTNATPVVPAGVIFSDNYDAQDDFTSTMHIATASDEQQQRRSQGDILPTGYDWLYQTTAWSPEKGFPDKHASIEILAANADKARGGTGKSYVHWRESTANRRPSGWGSDAQLIKVLDADYEELYVEFYIRFSPNWYQREPGATRSGDRFGWASKLLRIGHWDRQGTIFNSQDEALNPRFFWDYKEDAFGLRNSFTFIEGPPGRNDKLDQGGSKNYQSMAAGRGVNGADAQVSDVINGGYVIDRVEDIEHEQVFGPTETWTKMGFWVKLNSAPGVADGQMQMWINDQRAWTETSLAWVKANPDNAMPKWNYVALGGNSNFLPYPDEDQFEDWCAFDDHIIRDSKPEGLV